MLRAQSREVPDDAQFGLCAHLFSHLVKAMKPSPMLQPASLVRKAGSTKHSTERTWNT